MPGHEKSRHEVSASNPRADGSSIRKESAGFPTFPATTQLHTHGRSGHQTTPRRSRADPGELSHLAHSGRRLPGTSIIVRNAVTLQPTAGHPILNLLGDIAHASRPVPIELATEKANREVGLGRSEPPGAILSGGATSVQTVGCGSLASSTYWVKTVGRQGPRGMRKGQLVADLLSAEVCVGTSSLDFHGDVKTWSRACASAELSSVFARCAEESPARARMLPRSRLTHHAPACCIRWRYT